MLLIDAVLHVTEREAATNPLTCPVVRNVSGCFAAMIVPSSIVV